MADGSSSNNSNNAIWVAVITVAGSLVSAVLVNSDKLFPHHDKTAVTAPTPSAAAAPQPATAALNASSPAGPAEKPQASAPAAAQTPVDKPAPAPAAQPASSGPDASAAQLEANAVDTVRQYYEAWSNPSDPQGRAVAQFFGPSVNFYGKQMSLQDVIADKMRFAQRWPERTYVIRPNSLQTECSPDTRSCRVAGTIDWRAVNNARAGHLSGTSTFTVVLNGGVIIAEDGRVLSRN